MMHIFDASSCGTKAPLAARLFLSGSVLTLTVRNMPGLAIDALAYHTSSPEVMASEASPAKCCHQIACE
jgi:hypothetical protein